jgi:hypothetical protein
MLLLLDLPFFSFQACFCVTLQARRDKAHSFYMFLTVSWLCATPWNTTWDRCSSHAVVSLWVLDVQQFTAYWQDPVMCVCFWIVLELLLLPWNVSALEICDRRQGRPLYPSHDPFLNTSEPTWPR